MSNNVYEFRRRLGLRPALGCRLIEVNRVHAGLALAAGFGLASATAPAAHSLSQARSGLAAPQIVELAVAVARSAVVPGTAGLHGFEKGKLVSQDVSTLDLTRLDVSAFGDTDEPAR